MIIIQHTLAEMGWPQPPSLLQTKKLTAEGGVNNTIFSKKFSRWI